MKIHSFLLSCALSVVSFHSLIASNCGEETCEECCEPCADEQLFWHQFFIGPEVYGVKRTREGGTEQTGCLVGVRAGYDYVRRYCLYWGIEGLYAEGKLEGHSGENQKIKSHLVDANIEGRVGYTFETKNSWHFSFTPFLGIGYFWEYNDYQKPSPLRVHFKNTFYYIPIGFLSRFFLSSNMSLGLNFKARFLLDGKTKVEDDSELESQSDVDFDHTHLTLRYEEKIQYRVELPASYYFCFFEKEAVVSLVPFYEYRHYGHRTNFPFDFLDTKFQIYGATLRLGWVF